jgi:hypothetical protein
LLSNHHHEDFFAAGFCASAHAPGGRKKEEKKRDQKSCDLIIRDAPWVAGGQLPSSSPPGLVFAA